MKKPAPSCFTIPLQNNTNAPMEIVLFADNRQKEGQAALPVWGDLSTQFDTLSLLHQEISNEFQTLQVENDTAVRPNFDFRRLKSLAYRSALVFDALKQSFGVQNDTHTSNSPLRQIAREVAITPILLHSITLTANNDKQIMQTYLYEKEAVLRRGEAREFDFMAKFDASLKADTVTLTQKDFGKEVRFDGITGLRFTLLPHTQMSLQFCFELAPVCCPSPQASPKKAVRTGEGLGENEDMPAEGGGGTIGKKKPAKKPEKAKTAPKKETPPKPKAALSPVVLALIAACCGLMLVAGMLYWVLRK